MMMMCSIKRGAKDGTQDTSTEGVSSLLGNEDGKVWSETQEEN